MILFSLVCGKANCHPFLSVKQTDRSNNSDAWAALLRRQTVVQWPAGAVERMPHGWKELIEGLVCQDPAKRWGLEQVRAW